MAAVGLRRHASIQTLARVARESAGFGPTTRALSTCTVSVYFRQASKSPYASRWLNRPSSRPIDRLYHSRRYFNTRVPPVSKARYAYKLAAAFSGKKLPFDKDQNYCQYDSDSGRHWHAAEPVSSAAARRERHASGQDAFFMGNVGTADAVAFAVADGVGGWSDKGIDSAAFAHGLCDHMSDVASEFVNDGQTQLEPVILLQTAYNRVCHDNKIGGGGSTACVAVAEPDGVLNVANLGDSGFLQLRLNAVHDWSEPQTHAFNTPYQLSQVPPAVLKQIERYGGRHPYQDMPANSDVTSHELLHGDVLVFASDGVWDNLSFEDVLVAVAALMKERGAWTTSNRGGVDVSKGLVGLTDETEPGAQPALQTEIAQSLVTKAKAASLDTKRNGPFAKEVRKAFPREYWAGGKPDDICVVVAIVLEQGS